MARIRIDCRQAHWLLSHRRDGPLRLSERLALWVHLRYCDVCTTVARQFRLLSEAVRRLDEP